MSFRFRFKDLPERGVCWMTGDQASKMAKRRTSTNSAGENPSKRLRSSSTDEEDGKEGAECDGDYSALSKRVGKCHSHIIVKCIEMSELSFVLVTAATTEQVLCV